MQHQTRQRVERVIEEICAGTSRPELIEKLSAEFGIATRTMDYFITLANKELDKEVTEMKEIMARLRQEQLTENATELIMNEQEADAYLTQIIRGERVEEKVISTSNGAVVVKVAPRITDMLKVIEAYYYRDSVKRNRRKMGEKIRPPPPHIKMHGSTRKYAERN